ncbi:hypothetical protein OQE61_06595 [Cetobacterium somerae]|nr:hypothetical protein [Cetobacterium somerae]MCX3067158.1 hypothetical protein [Cetobacterium somerae]
MIISATIDKPNPQLSTLEFFSIKKNGSHIFEILSGGIFAPLLYIEKTISLSLE